MSSLLYVFQIQTYFDQRFCSSCRYYWKGLYEDMNKFAQKCQICQKEYRKLKRSAKLHPIPIKPKFWSRVGVDLIGPLTETSRGNKDIVSCTDSFSKWPEAAALPNKTAKGVAMFLFDLFYRHGCCEIQITDQG